MPHFHTLNRVVLFLSFRKTWVRRRKTRLELVGQQQRLSLVDADFQPQHPLLADHFYAQHAHLTGHVADISFICLLLEATYNS